MVSTLKKILICIFLMGTLFCACKKSNTVEDVKDRIAKAKAYTSTAEMTVTNNKGSSNYKVKQYCIYQEKLRIETLQPEFLKNKVLVKNNGSWKIYHPLVKQILSMSKLMEDDELILMGVMQRDLFTTKEAKVSYETYNDVKCACITSDILKGNKYRKTAKLYVELDENIPISMEIFDDTGTKRVEVKYIDFTYKDTLDDKLFSLNRP